MKDFACFSRGMTELRPEQIRAARSLLGWSQSELAEKSAVHFKTIARLETDGGDQHAVSRVKVQRGLEAGGVIFIAENESHGPGVRLAKGVNAEKPRRKAQKKEQTTKLSDEGKDTQP